METIYYNAIVGNFDIISFDFISITDYLADIYHMKVRHLLPDNFTAYQPGLTPLSSFINNQRFNVDVSIWNKLIRANNYKNAINAIHTYNRVIRRTRDEVISRENSEEREITVNPEPEQKSQNDISKDLLQYEEPLQPTITNSEEKLREKRRGNVKVEPPKKSRHSKKYYRNKAGYSSKAKGGRKPKGKART